ncbi:MAG: hypothetical protein WCJ30_06000, partial [Deltaproteobacteria bacterium]
MAREAVTGLEPFLRRLATALDTAGVPFMIAGSFASTAHGVPRTTQDIDVVIDPPDPERFLALLAAFPPERYYLDHDAALDALRRRSMFNLIDQASGWKADFIFRKNRRFSREEFARRIGMTVLGVPVFVASPEDTIVAKLEWSAMSGGSERQRRDVAGIVATLGAALDRAYIGRWIADLGVEVEWEQALKTP